MPPVTRRRGRDLERALLDAARKELTAVGYHGLTFEGVAARAHTSKPVLYRRWPTRAELVTAALFDVLPSDEEPPDTGSLRGDVIALLYRGRERFTTIGAEAVWGVMAESMREPALAEQLRSRVGTALYHGVLRRLIDRADERGEICAGSLPDRVVSLPTDLARSELLVHGELTDDAVISIVDEIFMPLVTSLQPEGRAGSPHRVV
ncbi:TetR/AcrR family transcriptional regulator [Nocardia araoensis]|uniref:TetR/AcrR family transcriptional regulator n=1 Tax=Nocardia araoensis TaxID=228600 RepID=UPI0002E1F8DF|nr:TetR/AcrR family transcriptional regulator [Nocardia araoensis]